ncbi:MAG: hypothetical protein ABIH26_04495 [Candidatus Eisenbacteria bacterium]
MHRLGVRRGFFALVVPPALFLLLLAGPIRAVETKETGPIRPPQRPLAGEPTVSSPLRESPDLYVFEDDLRRIELMKEGWLLRFKQKEGCVAYWLVEIYGDRGPIVWTREKGTLAFDIKEGNVRYKRTPLVTEEYSADRYGTRQIWRFSDNPVWEGGDLLIVGEILTPLEVRLIEDRIHFHGGEGWVGPFCTFEARDPDGNVLELAPMLEGKKITLRVPGSWLYRIARPRPPGSSG